MNNAITEVKNTLRGNNSIVTDAEKRISELEDRVVEVNEAEQKIEKKKKRKRNENSLTDFWDHVKSSSIWIIGVAQEELKRKGHEKIREVIIVQNFPKMGKEIVTQDQEAQRVP